VCGGHCVSRHLKENLAVAAIKEFWLRKAFLYTHFVAVGK